MSEYVQNQIEFMHPLVFSIALHFMSVANANRKNIRIDFNAIAPISQSVSNTIHDINAQRLITWGVAENATDVEIDSKKHTIRFKTLQNHPNGVVRALHNRLPAGWVWKFASKVQGFDIGYYIAKGREREFVDLSYDSEDDIAKFTQELWTTTNRKDETS